MTYSVTQFSYYKEQRRFVTEASDLTRGEIFTWVPGINNAGLSVWNPRTGNIVRFMIVNRHTSLCGDETIYWDLVPVHQDQVAFNIEDVTMRIYND